LDLGAVAPIRRRVLASGGVGARASRYTPTIPAYDASRLAPWPSFEWPFKKAEYRDIKTRDYRAPGAESREIALAADGERRFGERKEIGRGGKSADVNYLLCLSKRDVSAHLCEKRVSGDRDMGVRERDVKGSRICLRCVSTIAEITEASEAGRGGGE